MQTYIKSELYASFIKKLRPKPYIAFRLFMLYAVTLERSFLQRVNKRALNPNVLPKFQVYERCLWSRCSQR